MGDLGRIPAQERLHTQPGSATGSSRQLVCATCGQPAVWNYGPEQRAQGYCDNCIRRGCSCNLIPSMADHPRAGLEDVDEAGRLFPCCEYDFCAEGFDLNGYPLEAPQ